MKVKKKWLVGAVIVGALTATIVGALTATADEAVVYRRTVTESVGVQTRAASDTAQSEAKKPQLEEKVEAPVKPEPPERITIDLGRGDPMVFLRVDWDASTGKEPFYVSKYEVTCEQYDAVMGPGSARGLWAKAYSTYESNPMLVVMTAEALGIGGNEYSKGYRFGKMLQTEGKGTYPVSGLTRDQAKDYCETINGKGLSPDRYLVSLPTIEQWRHAARGGVKSRGYRYSGSDRITQVGWCRDNAVRGGLGRGFARVGELNPNELGLYDMSGSVGELCLDQSEGKAAVCGGSWADDVDACRVSSVAYWNPAEPSFFWGMRVVLNYDGKTKSERQAEREAKARAEREAREARERAEREAHAAREQKAKEEIKQSEELFVEINQAGRLYCVIDLTEGAAAKAYPVTYLKDVPQDGWTEEYKTTKLVLRCIPAGIFTMGSPEGEIGRMPWEKQHQVTLSKNFYIGVFEVTQKQWELVMGNNPSDGAKGESRPVNKVSYEDIRGARKGARWPASAAVDQASFLGKLRQRTGLDIDLPTEAEWEYACRAGTTTAFNNGKDITDAEVCANLAKVGRYNGNRGDEWSLPIF